MVGKVSVAVLAFPSIWCDLVDVSNVPFNAPAVQLECSHVCCPETLFMQCMLQFSLIWYYGEYSAACPPLTVHTAV